MLWMNVSIIIQVVRNGQWALDVMTTPNVSAYHLEIYGEDSKMDVIQYIHPGTPRFYLFSSHYIYLCTLSFRYENGMLPRMSEL